MIRQGIATAAIAAAALLLPATAHSQGNWQQVVSSQISRAAGFFGERGYERTHDIYNGSLADHESESMTLNLHAGTTYALIGVCDQDCTDIDLRLYDSDGDEVDSDLKTDDKPIVQVAPHVTGEYRVKVTMASCSTSPCFYGVGVYGK